MSVTTNYKYLFAQGLKWDAEDASTTFFLKLKAASRAQLQTVNGGQVLVGASGNGASMTFALPQHSQNWTASDVADMCADLMKRYTQTAINLGGMPPGGFGIPLDAAIFTELLKNLSSPVTQSTSDFTGLSPV